MFRLRALGGLTLERDGQPYVGSATQRRRLAVLAVLAASDSGVSRDRLIDHLWPEAEPARGRHSLDAALSRLRGELASDTLFLGVATLRLNPEVVTSDLAEQTAALATGDLERAVALYSGPFLDGFFVRAADGFERWTESERARRAQAHGRALEGLATACASRGDEAGAVRWWQARVALDPLDTAATLALLGALTTSGNRAEALRAARVHEALVREQIDSAPGHEWTLAVESIRAGAHAVGAASAADVSHRSSAHVPPQISKDQSAPELARPAPDEVEDTPVSAIPPSTSSPVTAAAASAPLARAPLARARLPVRLIFATVVLVAGVAWLATRARRVTVLPEAPQSIEPSAAPRRSVAVLPFVNVGGDPSDEPFADGLTDELIGTLSKAGGVWVTGRTSAFALKGRGLTVRAIADTLGVATVLEGSVRRAGGRVRVTAQLVGARDNAVIWSDSYDRAMKDVFTLQEEIARAIVGALAPALVDQAGSVRAIRPRELATYELYLKGRYFWGRRTPGDLRRAVGYFEQAIARDATYADAYAGLADARMMLVLLADSPPRDELPRARAAAHEAIRLDSTLAEAHATLGNILEGFDWDRRGADREFARAVALDPGYATAHLYWGIHLLNRGQLDKAFGEFKQASTLDPLSAPVRMQLGRAYVAARRPDLAIPPLRSALELNPQFAAAHVQLGEAYLQQGKATDALTAFRHAAALSGGRDSALIAYGLALSGEGGAAARLLGALLEGTRGPYRPPVPVAKAYTALGDADAAFRWLDRGAEERAGAMEAINVTPAFDPLHADRRWSQLLERLGLQR